MLVFLLVTAGLFVPLEAWFSAHGRPLAPRAAATCVGLLTFNTPAFHHLHHSADPADHDRNFAGTVPLVDMLFGTYRRPRGFPAALGLAAPAMSSTGVRGTTG